MAEIANAIACDVYELGKMILMVMDFLDLGINDFPEFDIAYSLERTINSSCCFDDVYRSLIDKMKK